MIAAWNQLWSSVMKNTSKLLAVALVAAIPAIAAPAAAAPLGHPLQSDPMAQNAVTQDESAPLVQQVQYRRWGGGGWRRGGWWGPAGIAAGILGGAAIAASRPWYGYDDYEYGPGYAYAPGSGYAYAPGYSYEPGYTYERPASGDDVAYCQQRFRSYDPASGTYLGYDGARHPCP
jgi:hypothetical protein